MMLLMRSNETMAMPMNPIAMMNGAPLTQSVLYFLASLSMMVSPAFVR